MIDLFITNNIWSKWNYIPVCIISQDFEHEMYTKSSLREETTISIWLRYKICPKCIFRGARSLVITDIIILFPGRVPPPPEALINFIRYCWHQKLTIVCARRGGGAILTLAPGATIPRYATDAEARLRTGVWVKAPRSSWTLEMAVRYWHKI